MMNIPILGFVENYSYLVCPDCGKKISVFGESKIDAISKELGIPVLAATYNGDLFPNSHPNYYGNFGIIGGRAGNLMMQNADLVIGMGCRMAFRQIGFNYEQFSPNSRRLVIDVDENELKKQKY